LKQKEKNLKFATLLVDNCLLTGSIPTHFGLLTSLRRLLLWANRLTGALPTELGKLTSLAHISVGTATPLFKNKFYHCIVCIYRFEWFIVAVANRARFIEELGVFTLGQQWIRFDYSHAIGSTHTIAIVVLAWQQFYRVHSFRVFCAVEFDCVCCSVESLARRCVLAKYS